MGWWVDVFALKGTYHENKTSSVFKCDNPAPGVSPNLENVKKGNTVTLLL